MKNLFLIGILFLGSCASLGGSQSPPTPPEKRIGLTSQAFVKSDAAEGTVVLFPTDELPKEIVEALGASPENPVVATTRENLKPPPPEPPFIPFPDDLSKESWWELAMSPALWGSILGAVGGAAGQAAPWLGVVEGIGLLFSQRKRQHYAKAGRALTEFNPREVLVNVGKAAGFAHSTEKSKTVTRKELG